MSPRYGSILRSYVVRNLEEAALTSGTDIVVPATGGFIRTAPMLTEDIHNETNFIVEKVGIFSNFADGLVLKDPQNRFHLAMSATAYQRASDPYTLSFTYGSKNVTTAVGNPGWTPAVNYPVAIQNPVTSGWIVMYITATAATTGTLEDYWLFPTSTPASETVTEIVSSTDYDFKSISVLNCMYNVNQFFQPLLFSGGSSYDYIGIRVALNQYTSHNTTFMTHSINSAFDTSTVHFDAILDVEFTGA